MTATVPIPIAAGRQIAESYGYDQVVIVARKVGVTEHVTTYGVDKTHCGVAARMGDFFKHKLMGWPAPNTSGLGVSVLVAGRAEAWFMAEDAAEDWASANCPDGFSMAAGRIGA